MLSNTKTRKQLAHIATGLVSALRVCTDLAASGRKWPQACWGTGKQEVDPGFQERVAGVLCSVLSGDGGNKGCRAATSVAVWAEADPIMDIGNNTQTCTCI